MKKESLKKYRAYRPVEFPERIWPNKKIEKAPRWASVDLRDGNQALVYPMSIAEKAEMFQLLLDIGFREIEVGFPSASEIEFSFLRYLVDNRMVPDSVSIQVLTQAREHLIDKTMESLRGVKKSIVHLYNSTSTLQREVVFRKSKQEILELSVQGVKMIKERMQNTDSEIILQYSPESFTGTELDFAVDVCEAVMNEWGRSPVILNLPATVEMTTPNLYADQVEYFSRNIKNRGDVVISLHTHNDRGTGVAATELGLLAGADRVEGTLMGNGERTGNVDLLTVALNMATQGIDPELDFSDVNRIVEVYERTTRMKVHPRHPYAGELVFTAFSGSHQDAINKGIAAYRAGERQYWEVPYLPIDPEDIGRTYDSIIRINSQSGKGGVAYVMAEEYGCLLPKTMQPEFAAIIQKRAERQGGEVKPSDIWDEFEQEYLKPKMPYQLVSLRSEDNDLTGEQSRCELIFRYNEDQLTLKGQGNGPIDAAKKALMSAGHGEFRIKNFSEHSIGTGSDAKAVSYIQIEANGENWYGVGISPNISRAGIEALFCAMNRAAARS